MAHHLVYVAGKWEDRKRAKVCMQKAEGCGLKVVLDWTNHEENGEEALRKWSQLEVEAIRKCSTAIFLFDWQAHYRGALVELGVALALKKRVVIVGCEADACAFCFHPSVERVTTFDKAIELLRR